MSLEVPPPTPETSAPLSSRLIPVLTILILAALAVYGYWRFIHYPSTPQYAVEELISAGTAKRYDRVYDLVKLTGPLRAAVRGPEDIKRYAQQFPAMIPDVEDYEIISARINGEKATVMAKVLASKSGRTTESRVDFMLVRDSGVWRLDGDWIVAEALRRGLGGAILGGTQD